jgi:hypothetical protein
MRSLVLISIGFLLLAGCKRETSEAVAEAKGAAADARRAAEDAKRSAEEAAAGEGPGSGAAQANAKVTGWGDRCSGASARHR